VEINSTYIKQQINTLSLPPDKTFLGKVCSNAFHVRDRPAIADGEAPYYAGVDIRNAETSRENHDAGPSHTE
jgi:hypothetical protein